MSFVGFGNTNGRPVSPNSANCVILQPQASHYEVIRVAPPAEELQRSKYLRDGSFEVIANDGLNPNHSVCGSLCGYLMV